jgi:hypothetical protein
LGELAIIKVGAGKRAILKTQQLNKEFVFAKLQICHLKVHGMPFIS